MRVHLAMSIFPVKTKRRGCHQNLPSTAVNGEHNSGIYYYFAFLYIYEIMDVNLCIKFLKMVNIFAVKSSDKEYFYRLFSKNLSFVLQTVATLVIVQRTI